MAIRTYKVTLDTKNAIAPEPVYLRQGDKTGAVVIDASVTDNGSPVSLYGLAPMFKANTADGKAVIADGTGFNIVNESGGKFTYQVPNALSAVAGKVTTAYFSFSDSSGAESTFDVVFVVKKAVDFTQEQANDYITIVDGTLNSLSDKLKSMSTDIQTILNNYNQGNFYNKSYIDGLKNNLQNLVLSKRHRLTYKSVSVSLTPNAEVRPPTADFEFKHLANMGVSATFVVMLNVTDKNDPNVQMPDDTIISKAISEATAAGVPVTMIKPHIGVSFMDWLDRSTYVPSDWDVFWTNWQNIMLHYAGICDANGIPILCLGCEQYHCTDASMMQQWETLTAAIRSKYPNLKLTYATVGDEYFNEEHAQIAQYLDFMGANFYPSYTYKIVQPDNAGGISVDELARVFYTADPRRLGTGNTRTYHEMVDFYQQKYNVQTFVTETGVMPTDDGLVHLVSDNELVKASDPTKQTGRFETPALAMEGFFNGLAQNPNIIGFAWWSVGYPFHFFNALGDSVAENVMKKYVKGGLI